MNLRQIVEVVQRSIPTVSSNEIVVRANAALRSFVRSTDVLKGTLSQIPAVTFDLPATMITLERIRALDTDGVAVETTYQWTNRGRTIYLLDEEAQLLESLDSGINSFELYGKRQPAYLDEPEEEPEIDSEWHMYIVYQLIGEMSLDFGLAQANLVRAKEVWRDARKSGSIGVRVPESIGVPPIFAQGGIGITSNQLPGTIPYLRMW